MYLNKINTPKTVEKYMAMLDWAVEQNEHPVIIANPTLSQL